MPLVTVWYVPAVLEIMTWGVTNAHLLAKLAAADEIHTRLSRHLNRTHNSKETHADGMGFPKLFQKAVRG